MESKTPKTKSKIVIVSCHSAQNAKVLNLISNLGGPTYMRDPGLQKNFSISSSSVKANTIIISKVGFKSINLKDIHIRPQLMGYEIMLLYKESWAKGLKAPFSQHQ